MMMTTTKTSLFAKLDQVLYTCCTHGEATETATATPTATSKREEEYEEKLAAAVDGEDS